MLNVLLDGGVWSDIANSLGNLWRSTGLFAGTEWQNYVMIAISFVLFYLAIVKKFEPLLMLPIAFGMFICNIPGVYHELFGTKGYVVSEVVFGSDGAYHATHEIFRGTLQEVQTAFGNPEITKSFIAEAIKESNGIVEGLTLNGYTYDKLLISSEQVIRDFGLFYYIYKGVDWVIFPPLIFLGIGCMTDFGPLIANPKSMIIGAAAQLGIFITFLGAVTLLG